MKKKLGEILVTSGAVSGADVDAALQEQSAGEPSRLGDLLVATGKLDSTQLARALAEQYELPYVELPPLPQAVLDLVPLDLQRQFRFVPLKSVGTELHIAMADLANLEVVATLEQQWTKVHVNVSSGDEIDALHATLSGLFAAPVIEGEAAPGPNAEDLFGSLELDAEPEPAGVDLGPPPVLAVSPSQVLALASAQIASPPPQAAPPMPAIAPVVASVAPPASSPQLADDLFGDLNLESARTGISAKLPEEPPRLVAVPALEPEPLPDVDPVPLEPEPEPVLVPESSGPVLTGEVVAPGSTPGAAEGTGPLLDLLAREGTGPVVDTPFFTGGDSAPVVPAMSDAPFVSSRSSLNAPALQPQAAAPKSDEDLPDWLKSGPAEGAAAVSSAPTSLPPPVPSAPAEWTGALDHLMPSRLVVGLTRALLARGIVTEEEILAALGQKK